MSWKVAGWQWLRLLSDSCLDPAWWQALRRCCCTDLWASVGHCGSSWCLKKIWFAVSMWSKVLNLSDHNQCSANYQLGKDWITCSLLSLVSLSSRVFLSKWLKIAKGFPYLGILLSYFWLLILFNGIGSKSTEYRIPSVTVLVALSG